MKNVWGVFHHINCYVDGCSETIQDLACLCATEELAIKRQKELEEPKIKELIKEGWSRKEAEMFFLDYSYCELYVEELSE